MWNSKHIWISYYSFKRERANVDRIKQNNQKIHHKNNFNVFNLLPDRLKMDKKVRKVIGYLWKKLVNNLVY